MLQTKIKYENKQRAITQNLGKQDLRFICTALPLNAIYPSTKFHNPIASIVLEKSCGQNSSITIKKGYNSKIKQARVTIHVHCTSP